MNQSRQIQEDLGVDFSDVDEAADVQKVIKALINTKFSGSNEEQGKAVQLLRGLAFSDDPASNKFMKALDEYTSGLKAEDFSEALGERGDAGKTKSGKVIPLGIDGDFAGWSEEDHEDAFRKLRAHSGASPKVVNFHLKKSKSLGKGKAL